MPSRSQTVRQSLTRVAMSDGVGAARRPQGLDPLANSLSSSMLPSWATRSFHGLAYLQDFSPISLMRNVVLVLTRCRVRLGWASAPKRTVSVLTVTTGLAVSRRGGSGPTCAGPSPGAEAPRSGRSHLRPGTNLRSLAVTSSGASRRGGYGALDDLPPLLTGSGDIDRHRKPESESPRGQTVLPWSSLTCARPSAEASGRLSPWERRSTPGAEAPAGEEPDRGAEGTTWAGRPGVAAEAAPGR